MTRDTFDINDAGEQPGPVVFSGDQSGKVRRLASYVMAGGFGFLVGWLLVAAIARAVGG